MPIQYSRFEVIANTQSTFVKVILSVSCLLLCLVIILGGCLITRHVDVKESECVASGECAGDRICISGRCEDVCAADKDVCGSHSTCRTHNHQMSSEVPLLIIQDSKYQTSEELIVDVVEGAWKDPTFLPFSHEESFLLTPLHSALELTKLRFWIKHLGVYNCTARVAPVNTTVPDIVTITHRDNAASYEWDYLPISTPMREVLLFPNISYNITLSCSENFGRWNTPSGSMSGEDFSVEHSVNGSVYSTPVAYVHYKTLKPLE